MTVNKCDICGKIYDDDPSSVIILKDKKKSKFTRILAKVPGPFSMNRDPIAQDICSDCWGKIEKYIEESTAEESIALDEPAIEESTVSE